MNEKPETALYQRIAEFEAEIRKMAWDRGIRLERFQVDDDREAKSLTLRADFVATSAFKQEAARP